MKKFDLKESKTADPETFEHLLTVLKGLLSEDYMEKRNFEEAGVYLKGYISELFKQLD